MSSKAQTREKDYERGLRIADRRKAMGLSQDELAHSCLLYTSDAADE